MRRNKQSNCYCIVVLGSLKYMHSCVCSLLYYRHRLRPTFPISTKADRNTIITSLYRNAVPTFSLRSFRLKSHRILPHRLPVNFPSSYFAPPWCPKSSKTRTLRRRTSNPIRTARKLSRLLLMKMISTKTRGIWTLRMLRRMFGCRGFLDRSGRIGPS